MANSPHHLDTPIILFSRFSPEPNDSLHKVPHTG